MSSGPGPCVSATLASREWSHQIAHTWPFKTSSNAAPTPVGQRSGAKKGTLAQVVANAVTERAKKPSCGELERSANQETLRTGCPRSISSRTGFMVSVLTHVANWQTS
jgi:hypothetical protein